MQLWSHAYLNDPTVSALCLIEERAWLRAQEAIDGRRLFASIRNGDRTLYSAIGSPVPQQEGTGDRLFVPTWILDQLGLDGAGDEVVVEWLSEEFFPEASRLVLRPRDSAFYHADAKGELERALTQIGVLQSGTTITVPLDILGGYEVEFDVIVTEPADLVLMQGDEVVIEFEEALDGAAEAQAPVRASPAVIPFEMSEEESMVPEPPIVPEPVGHVLGGTSRRMADGRAWNPWR